MRFLAIIPAVCGMVSFILTMLCIFAGSSPGFMEDTAIITLNTSMLGQTLNLGSDNSSSDSGSSSSSSSGGGLLGDLENGISNEVHNLSSKLENEIGDKLNEYAHDLARALNISDFYSLHMLDYCKGYYTPGPQVNATNPNPSQNVTFCSNRTSMFAWNPQQEIQSGMPSGVNLTELGWPDYLQEAISDAQGAMQATFVFYCIGAAMAGIAMISSAVGVAAGTTMVALVSCALDVLGFFSLLIASALATWAINDVSEVVNGLGNDIGVFAYKGTKFVGLTWAATALMFVAACLWLVDVFLGRKQGRYLPRRMASKV